MSRRLHRRDFARPAIGIVVAHDVIFAQIGTGLDLYEAKRLLAGVFQTVPRADRDISGLVFLEQEHLVIASHLGGALHDHPMFRTLGVALQRETSARLHHDVLDLITVTGVDTLIAAPRAKNDLMLG